MTKRPTAARPTGADGAGTATICKRAGPIGPALLQMVAGEHFEKYWTEEKLRYETVDLAK